MNLFRLLSIILVLGLIITNCTTTRIQAPLTIYSPDKLDYDGDGHTDIAYYQPAGSWETLPIQFSNGDGSWRSTNHPVPYWANEPGAIHIPGDYNGDGKPDIAFHRPGSDWNIVPVLFGNGDGTWVPSYESALAEKTIHGVTLVSSTVGKWASQPGVTSIPGDFNGDGISDIAFHRPGSDWKNIPILFGQRDGDWTAIDPIINDGGLQPDPTIGEQPFLPGDPEGVSPVLLINGKRVQKWANWKNIIAIPGDYDGDGKTDIALQEGERTAPTIPWNIVPVLLSNGDGNWRSSNAQNLPFSISPITQPTFPSFDDQPQEDFTPEQPMSLEAWVNRLGAIPIVGDFNGDSITDIAFHSPGTYMEEVPVLLSVGDGAWTENRRPVPDWANEEGVIATPGDFNGDEKTDIAFARMDIGFLIHNVRVWDVPVLLTSSTADRWTYVQIDPTHSSYKGWTKRRGAFSVPGIPGDFNNDGHTDLYFHNPGPNNSGDLLYSNGDGTWKYLAGSGGSENLPDDIDDFVVTAVTTSLAGPNKKPWNTIYELKKAYSNPDSINYRKILFREFKDIRNSDINTILRRTIELLDYISKYDADGLEPLLFSYMDAIALSKGYFAKNFIKNILNRYANSWPNYTHGPRLNTPMPLGRINSPLVVDIRADALREIIKGYHYAEDPVHSVPTYEELLAEAGIQESICNLPLALDSEGLALDSERQREEDCENGAPGQGGANDPMNTLYFGSCLNLNGRDAQYLELTTSCMLDKMLVDIGDNNLGPDITFWPVIVAAVIGVAGLVAAISTAENAAYTATEKAKAADANYNEAQKNYKQALGKGDESEISQARTNLQNAKDHLNEVIIELINAYRSLGRRSLTGGLDGIPDWVHSYANHLRQKAQQPIPILAKDVIIREEEIQGDDPVAILKLSEDIRECMCSNMSQEQCNNLFPDGYFQEILQGDRSPLDPFINPDPEDPNGDPNFSNSIFDLTLCGNDYNTNKGGADCSILIQCEFGPNSQIPDDDCTCRDLPSDQEKAQAQQMATDLCATLINCPDGLVVVSGPYGCTCISGDEQEVPDLGNIPKPPIDLWQMYFFNADEKITPLASEAVWKEVFRVSNHPYQLRNN